MPKPTHWPKDHALHCGSPAKLQHASKDIADLTCKDCLKNAG